MPRVIIFVAAVYFAACMFVEPIAAIFILSPIFQPYVFGKIGIRHADAASSPG